MTAQLTLPQLTYPQIAEALVLSRSTQPARALQRLVDLKM
jgi:hypothetical protein